jgi:hypothetical protein
MAGHNPKRLTKECIEPLDFGHGEPSMLLFGVSMRDLPGIDAPFPRTFHALLATHDGSLI